MDQKVDHYQGKVYHYICRVDYASFIRISELDAYYSKYSKQHQYF